MNSKNIKKIVLVPVIAVTAVITLGFLLGGQENKDFRLTKNLDIYISLFRELNAFYVDEIDPEKLVTRSINSMLATDVYKRQLSELYPGKPAYF